MKRPETKDWRGQAADKAALAQTLREGRIAAAASDVFEDAPLPKNSPLLTLCHKVLPSPHKVSSNRKSSLYPCLVGAIRSALKVLIPGFFLMAEGQHVNGVVAGLVTI